MSSILDRVLVLVQRCRRIQPAGYELTLHILPHEQTPPTAKACGDAFDLQAMTGNSSEAPIQERSNASWRSS